MVTVKFFCAIAIELMRRVTPALFTIPSACVTMPPRPENHASFHRGRTASRTVDRLIDVLGLANAQGYSENEQQPRAGRFGHGG
jgi:hypothetical protein